MALAVTRPASASSAPETTEPVATTSTWGSRTSLYDFMRSAATPEAPQKSPIAKELATFLLEPALQQDADPLAFWSARRAVYPHLEVAAKNALAVPASSGPSERVFSMSGKMFSPARSRLSGDLAESMMHVKFRARKMLSPGAALRFGPRQSGGGRPGPLQLSVQWPTPGGGRRSELRDGRAQTESRLFSAGGVAAPAAEPAQQPATCGRRTPQPAVQ
ncbi:zinc finger BED domain-containing protein 4-like [Amphibalanus amphitrite]|uniref:zinc finger BED domain-containing protein 4-like n=1 Tax=Amphibalanus amphitrite TaxID=1232801 RepID=UPI001C926034|nr:zinc finger BED domain-containing protein 4-like [Amphibalanus amphitrite]